MKNRIFLFTFLIVLAIIGAIVFIVTQKLDEISVGKESIITNSLNIDDTTSRYIDYDQRKLTKQTNILFFTTTWDQDSKKIDKDIMKNQSKIPMDTIIFKVNYDTEKELKEKYHITTQNTFVQINEKGKEIQQWTDSKTLNEILSKIN